jgi:hypothetical protein
MTVYNKRLKTVCGRLHHDALAVSSYVIPGGQGTIRVVDASLKIVGGAMGTATTVKLEDDSAGTVDIVTFGAGTLDHAGDMVRAGGTDGTIGAGFNVDLTPGCGVTIISDAEMSGATDVDYVIEYVTGG